ncbi:arsenate reductase ArsC [Methylococcus mesophilus]|uniref:arsenate reductase ArsC n=1 Tax=Methylococcus mesophilus TaxID=2993564 RepID=UPI00224A5812|nr:arsenate reductase ArsC [Methylococcus mesophilus]UZR29242.1 arsenate reductase ArsC [Methylococcus mesophilus]
MNRKLINVLVLCTGNSCRSILGEALLNHLGGDRLRAWSAGSHPTGKVNPHALATLRRHGLPADCLGSKSWDALGDIVFDILITVCDDAAGETCPAYLGQAIRGHWGMPDPAKATGTLAEIDSVFDATFETLENRVRALMALRIEHMSPAELSVELERIGKIA